MLLAFTYPQNHSKKTKNPTKHTQNHTKNIPTTTKQTNKPQKINKTKKQKKTNIGHRVSIKELTNQMIVQRANYFGRWGCMLTYHTNGHMTYMFLTNSICERSPQFLEMQTVAHCFSKQIVWQGRQ